MNHREREALDRHITGNYGEDQFPEDAGEMTPEQEELEAAAAELEFLDFLRDKLAGISTLAIDCRNAVQGGDLELQRLTGDLERAVINIADIILERREW